MPAVSVLDILPGEFDAFQAVGQRQYEVSLPDAHQQPVDNRQGQGQPQRHRSARARRARDFDRSAQTLDAPPYHVHADPASGNIGHLARRREARSHDQGEDLRLREPSIGVDQPLFDGPGPHRFRVHAVPVVSHPDQHVGPGVMGRKMNSGSSLLAGRPPLFRRFHAVVHGVSNQVDQGIVQLIDYGFIQFRVGPFDCELDLFVQFDSQVVNQPAEPVEGGLQRQHADAHGVFPQRRRKPVYRFGDIQNVRVVQPAGDFTQARLHGHQFAHKIDKLIQLFGRYPDTRLACPHGGRPRGNCRRGRRR